MPEIQYQITRDSYRRLCAQVAPDVSVSLKVLSETDERRIKDGIHAYVVLTLATVLGPMRIRNVKILWSEQNERYFVRWHQFPTGQTRPDGRREYLDVAGPTDPETRKKFEGHVLGVFHQIREEAQLGTLGQDPEVRANLQRLKKELQRDEKPLIESAE